MRAIRLARLADNEVALATAHLGWGMLYFNQGDYLHAEVHFTRGYRCAMRAGFHGLAGSATHDILVVSISSGRYDDAMPQATAAAKLYTADHPRFPLLAHDVAFLLSRLGYYSSALPVLEKCLPFVEGTRERILVLATLARAAGAVRDRLRFERAAAEVVRLAAHSEEMSDMSLYHVAQGARGFEMWERARELGGRAAAIATRSGNKYILQAAPALLNSIENREPGDEDVVPPEGGEIDALVAKLLKRLQKHTAPHDGRAVPVEKFPKY
ncbi:hypothetical protein [Longimicrobium sp.]|jgi:tetratricopeptide (TPR) repeat protein|uniref:hypothetical protein n=1 Tax=Longimicrobium sp. TaxID=2029185 RepID=UPI002EDB4366